MGNNPNQMKALVTGGGGFIGSALVRDLLRRGFIVTSFSRGDYPELRETGVLLKRGDISNRAEVSDACNGIEIIFHVAAKAGIWGSYKDYYNVNVKGTENILLACCEKNVKRLIYTSSASVIFDGTDIKGANESLPYPEHPLSHYSATKALAEQSVLNADSASLKTIVLRPHLVIGPGDNHLIPRILARAREGKLKQIGDGNNKVDISYIDNVISAHICAAQAIDNPGVSGKTYFISNGEPVLLWDFINMILKNAGIEPINKTVSVRTAFVFSLLAELFHKIPMIKKEPRLTRFLVHELSKSHWFDISASRKHLNYFPQISNRQSLEKLFK
jgi:nucleoside-diphosphate-sugar epimerase